MNQRQVEGKDLLAEVCRSDGYETIEAITAIEDVSGYTFDEGALYGLNTESVPVDPVSLRRGGILRLWIMTDEELGDVERRAFQAVGTSGALHGQTVSLARFKGRAARALPIARSQQV